VYCFSLTLRQEQEARLAAVQCGIAGPNVPILFGQRKSAVLDLQVV
jgi:hypothetical protein